MYFTLCVCLVGTLSYIGEIFYFQLQGPSAIPQHRRASKRQRMTASQLTQATANDMPSCHVCVLAKVCTTDLECVLVTFHELHLNTPHVKLNNNNKKNPMREIKLMLSALISALFECPPRLQATRGSVPGVLTVRNVRTVKRWYLAEGPSGSIDGVSLVGLIGNLGEKGVRK